MKTLLHPILVFFSAPVFEGDLGLSLRAKQIHTTLIISFITTLAFAITLLILEPQLAFQTVSTLPVFVCIILTMIINRKGYTRTAGIILITGLWITLSSTALYSGGIRTPGFYGNMVVVLIAGVLLGRWAAITYTALSLIAGLGLLYLERMRMVGPLAATPEITLVVQAAFFIIAAVVLQLAIESISNALNRARREIVEREFAEKALRESEERFRRMAESIPDGISIVEQGKVIYLNDRVTEITGFPREELLDKSGTEFAAPEERERLDALMAEAKKIGTLPPELEFWIVRKDGSRRCVHNRYTVKEWQNGFVNRYVVTTDITDRKLYEEQLRQKISELTVLNSISQIVLEADDEESLILRATSIIRDNLYPVNCGILLLDDTAKILRSSSSFYTRDPRARYAAIPLGKGITGTVAATGKARLVHDNRKEPDYIGIDPDLRSEVCVPLRAKQKVIGVIDVESDRIHAFDDNDVRLLTTIASQLATAIERMRISRAEEESENRYRILFESAGVGIFIIRDGLFTDCNLKILDMFVCERNELIGHTPAQVSPEIQPDGVRSEEKAAEKMNAAMTGTPQFFEWTHQRSDGSTFLVEITLTKIILAGQELLQAVVHDVTERKRISEELAVLGHAIRSVGECVSITDMNNITIFVNDAFGRTYGYQREEMIGKSIDCIRSPNNDQNILHQILPATLAGGWTGEILNRRKDGSDFPILLSTSVIRNEQQQAIALIGIAVDISERKRIESERLKLEEQLRQSQKMETIGQLAGGIAHDFNNLLAPIIGYAEVMMRDFHDEDPRHRRLSIIRDAAERAANLTRQLLSFSRKQVLDIRTFDLNKVIADFQKILRRTIREDITFEIVLSPSLDAIRGDISQIEQVIMNLAANAQDAMPNGGQLTIETSNVELDSLYASTHPEVTPGHYVMLSISDTGVGMDKTVLNKIFEPFFTTKEMGKGTGLGLATVYGIVKQHNGSIWVYSEIGQGTTFKIYLPRIGEETIQELEAADSVEKRGTETVLVVEDDEMVRNLAAVILRDYGYHVVDFGGAEDCIRWAKEHSEPIQLLLTDVVMPTMNGKQLFDNVHASHTELKVLYMSGYAENLIAHHGVIDEGIIFLQKPFTVATLTNKVHEALEK